MSNRNGTSSGAWPRPIKAAAVCFLVALAVLLDVPAQTAAGADAITYAGNSRAIVARARTAIGLNAGIKALTIEGTRTREPGPNVAGDKLGLKILLPSHFQSISTHATHTLTDRAYWQRPTLESNDAAVARRATEFRFQEYSLSLLLTAPSTLPVTARDVGLQELVEGTRFPAVEFADQRGFRLRMFFDAKTGLPVGYSSVERSAPVGPQDAGIQEATRTRRFVARRSVNGLSLPVQIDERITRFHSVTEFVTIAVNPPLSARQFEQPSR